MSDTFNDEDHKQTYAKFVKYSLYTTVAVCVIVAGVVGLLVLNS